MCGIFGVMAANRCHKVHESFLIDAFQAGQLRGMHGSGIFTVSPDGYVRNAALAVPGTMFLADDRAAPVLQSTPNSRIVVGHNRFTTSGGNDDSHCHPFRYEHVVGVHNGGLWDNVLKRIDPKRSHAVDSGRLYAAIDRADNPLDVLEQVTDGAYCLVWYDGRKRSMFMARNHQRPMHVAETPSGMYFASELGMLTWLLGRNNAVNYGPLKIASLNEHVLYEVPLDDPSQVSATPYVPTAPKVLPAPAAKAGDQRTALARQWDNEEEEEQPAKGRFRGEEAGRSNAHLHKYYRGDGLYGGAPAPVAFKRYYTDITLTKDFPCMMPAIDLLDYLEGEETLPTVPFLLMGIGRNVTGEKCAYGVLSSSDGNKQYEGILVSCRLLTAKEEDFVARLLAIGTTGDVGDHSFPVVPVQYRCLLLRPTGELIVDGELPISFDDEEVGEVVWVYGTDRTIPPYARMCVSPECLINMTPAQLVSAWGKLKVGETKIVLGDDLPW